ncbi:VOC family protein [Opitutales bacterium ASA1]|nr:VOC family protein [Opitutales bacterium ASA1]
MSVVFALRAGESSVKTHGMEPRITIITLGVVDLPRAIRFYRDGMGFPTEAKDDAPIAFFRTAGTRLALYPLDKLAEDVAPELKPVTGSGFRGFTLAHNVRDKADVEAVLARAAAAGGTIVKPAQDVFWGGYSGYFTDPDGHHWEVAWAESFRFDAAGSLEV